MEELVERLVRWNLHPADIITHRFPLERAGDAYALMASGKCGKGGRVRGRRTEIRRD
jgi:threonine dehydrogenase-like Zn-dependent dehydrogenase